MYESMCNAKIWTHSIELQMRKEMDMEIPELNVKTDIGAHVSLKCPSPNINIMTPPSKRVQLKGQLVPVEYLAHFPPLC